MSRDLSPTANCRGCKDTDSHHVEVDGDEWCQQCMDKSTSAALEDLQEIAARLPLDELPKFIHELADVWARWGQKAAEVVW